MTDKDPAPPEAPSLPPYWQGAIARLGVVSPEKRVELAAPTYGQTISTVTPLPLPLYALVAEPPAVGYEPTAPTMTVVGDITDLAATEDTLWARGRFHLNTAAGRTAAADLDTGRTTLAAINIRPDQTDVVTTPDGEITVYTSWVLLGVMLTDAPLFPDCRVQPSHDPQSPLVPVRA